MKLVKNAALADKNFANLASFNCCWARMFTRISFWTKEEGSWAALSQVYLRLGAHWSVVPCACLLKSILSKFSGTGSCSFLRNGRDSSSEAILQSNGLWMEHYDTTTNVAGDNRITVRLRFKFETCPSNIFQTA